MVYDQENSSAIKNIALYLSQKENKKIISFKDLYPRSYAHYQERYAGPIDFISLITHADIIITNSFHCSAFSIIMNRQFFVVPRTHQKVNSRMADLLSSLCIDDRLVGGIEAVEKASVINYRRVIPIVERMKESSFSYIDIVLASKSK